MILEYWLTHAYFRMAKGQPVAASKDYATEKLLFNPKVKLTDEDKDWIEFEAGTLLTGQVIKLKGHEPQIMGGDPGPNCFEADFHGVGNPDRSQYGDLYPKTSFRNNSPESLGETAKRLMEIYDLLPSNWSDGWVYQLRPGKRRKKIGQIQCDGTYITLADQKKRRAELDEKYGSLPK